MLHVKIIPTGSEGYTDHCAMCGPNIECFNIELGGTHSNRWDWKGSEVHSEDRCYT
jgi:hypothetical protein